MRNKRGFTLVELCIVMAVVAIVGTMVVTSTIFFTKQGNDIRADAAFISEVTAIQKSVNDWIKKYDSKSYSIAIENDGHTLSATKLDTNGHPVTPTVKNTLVYDGEKLTENTDVKIGEFSNVSGINFELSDESLANSNYIKVSVTAKDGVNSQTQTLLFAVFSGVVRDRSVTER